MFIGIATGTTTLEITDASLNDESGTLITPIVYNGSIKGKVPVNMDADFNGKLRLTRRISLLK